MCKYIRHYIQILHVPSILNFSHSNFEKEMWIASLVVRG